MDAKTLSAATGAFTKYTSVVAPYLAECFQLYDINSVKRQAGFLAESCHETMGYFSLKELWGPTPTQNGYEFAKRLGNTQPGDGKRYMGRGLFQYTGRANYTTLQAELQAVLPNEEVPDFLAYPEKLEEIRWAVLSAGNYWNKHHLNALADQGEIDAISRVINGGENGLEERHELYIRALGALPGTADITEY